MHYGVLWFLQHQRTWPMVCRVTPQVLAEARGQQGPSGSVYLAGNVCSRAPVSFHPTISLLSASVGLVSVSALQTVF